MTIEDLAAIKASKPPIAALPWRALVEVARVVAFGRGKYGADSWKRPPYDRKAIYLDAIGRHLAELCEGVATDPESGLPHIAHLACDALYYLWHELRERSEPAPAPYATPISTVHLVRFAGAAFAACGTELDVDALDTWATDLGDVTCDACWARRPLPLAYRGDPRANGGAEGRRRMPDGTYEQD